MNKFKYLALMGLAAAGLFAGQAYATTCPIAPKTGMTTQGSPVCIASYGQDGAGTGLANVLGPSTDPMSLFSSGPGINPYTQQVQTPFWSVSGSSGSVSTILLQLAGYAGNDTFGIFDPTNPSNMIPLISNGSNGAQALLTSYVGGGYSVNFGPTIYFGTTNYFGFYLQTPGGTFYSLPTLNGDGIGHMVAYQGNGSNTLSPIGMLSGGKWVSNEYILAWEDQLLQNSDLDYNDFLVMVESVRPVPEPAELGMFGLGLLLIGGFVAMRRRRQYNA